jgi:hypothetical protein
MMHLHPDVAHKLVREHMEHLRAEPERWREIRRASMLRRAVGQGLIRLGERVGGERRQPVVPAVTTKLAHP